MESNSNCDRVNLNVVIAYCIATTIATACGSTVASVAQNALVETGPNSCSQTYTFYPEETEK